MRLMRCEIVPAMFLLISIMLHIAGGKKGSGAMRGGHARARIMSAMSSTSSRFSSAKSLSSARSMRAHTLNSVHLRAGTYTKARSNYEQTAPATEAADPTAQRSRSNQPASEPAVLDSDGRTEEIELALLLAISLYLHYQPDGRRVLNDSVAYFVYDQREYYFGTQQHVPEEYEPQQLVPLEPGVCRYPVTPNNKLLHNIWLHNGTEQLTSIYFDCEQTERPSACCGLHCCNLTTAAVHHRSSSPRQGSEKQKREPQPHPGYDHEGTIDSKHHQEPRTEFVITQYYYENTAAKTAPSVCILVALSVICLILSIF